jgi:hypothetical protein
MAPLADPDDPYAIERAPGFFVCARCFEDDALKELITDSATEMECSYCGRKSRKKPIAAPLDLVVERIRDGFVARYEDAANGVGYEGGEYIGATTWDTIDLVEEHVEIRDEVLNTLHFKIADMLPQRIWSEIDPYGPRWEQVLRWTWKTFAETVKHHRRYFFLDSASSEPSFKRGEEMPAAEFLDSVVKGCIDYGLIKQVPAGYRLYRCRARQRRVRYSMPKDLGPPPARRASQSRMSAAGIPMFYGAEDASTALAETLFTPSNYAIAEFRTTRPTILLDITTPPHVSIFDDDRRHLYDWCSFMHSFIADFRKPVAKDGSEHIDYVPTQIVTEYIRSVARLDGKKIDGIRYSSARRPKGICCVLFATADDVTPGVLPGRPPTGSLHLLTMVKAKNPKAPSHGP